ncbi:hypothetical protein B0H14DRAFT_3612573 [Mycena olivaceomarginata]|nr:hypothetical protein B0H14DRAFT_3612573 [Mycena olivaceomarginata]
MSLFIQVFGVVDLRFPSQTTPTPRARRRITRVDNASEPSVDVNMEATSAPASERRIGDTYPPSRLPSIRGDYWAFDKAVLVQRNHKDIDGSLIARHELNDKLVEGTLVLVQLKFVTYIMTDRKTEKGNPMPDKKANSGFLTAGTVNLGTHRFRQFPSVVTGPQVLRREGAINCGVESARYMRAKPPYMRSRSVLEAIDLLHELLIIQKLEWLLSFRLPSPTSASNWGWDTKDPKYTDSAGKQFVPFFLAEGFPLSARVMGWSPITRTNHSRQYHCQTLRFPTSTTVFRLVGALFEAEWSNNEMIHDAGVMAMRRRRDGNGTICSVQMMKGRKNCGCPLCYRHSPNT